MRPTMPEYDEDGFEIDDESPSGAVFLTPMLNYVYRNMLGSTSSDPEFCRWVADNWKQYVKERQEFNERLFRCWHDLPEHPPIKKASKAIVKRLRAFFKPVSQSSHQFRQLIKFDLECMRVRRLLYRETWPPTLRQLTRQLYFEHPFNHEAYRRYERLRAWLRYHQDAEASARRKRAEYYSIPKEERRYKERQKKANQKVKKMGFPPPS